MFWPQPAPNPLAGREELIKRHFQQDSPVNFYGSLEDLRHAALMNTKALLMASDLYKKNYEFDYPPLTTGRVFINELASDIPARFMSELREITNAMRVAGGSAALSHRPLMVYMPPSAVSNFYNAMEANENKDVRQGLINSTVILITEGMDDVASSSFINGYYLRRFLDAPYLRMWYSQNCDIHHPKVRPLPIGTNHHHSDAAASFSTDTLSFSSQTPYLHAQHKEVAQMVALLTADGRVLQGLSADNVESKWKNVEECDGETLRGAERRSFTYGGADLPPCLLTELGSDCNVVLLAANIRSMSPQDRCGVINPDRTHFEQITGLADKPQLSVFVQKGTDGGVPTVYLPLVDLYYIFMASSLGHARRKMRVYGAFAAYSNEIVRNQSRIDLIASGVGDFELTSREENRRLLGEYAFTASPIGNGYDCHRTWEALLAGSIPVVLTPLLYWQDRTYNITALADIFADLPIFVVDRYRDLTEAKLKEWASEVREKAARGAYRFEKLFVYTYLNDIRKLVHAPLPDRRHFSLHPIFLWSRPSVDV